MTTVVAALIERDQKVLVCQRTSGKWEFPGGKVEPGESLEAALKRELQEELGILAEIGSEVERYEYAYPGKSPILLVFFRVTAFTGLLEIGEWSALRDLPAYDFLDGDVDFVRRLSAQAEG